MSACLPRSFDNDIMNAFDARYMKTVLNATGFNSNYVSASDHTKEPILKKPYWFNPDSIHFAAGVNYLT